MAFSDYLAIGAGKKLETDYDIKSRWSYHSWYPMWSAVGIGWVVPLKISQLCCVPAWTLQLEFHASTVGQLQIPACAAWAEISQMHLVCLCFFPQQELWLHADKQNRKYWPGALQEIHSFSSMKAPCFVLLSCAGGTGVYKSQQILNGGLRHTWGNFRDNLFFLISNMLTTTRFRENGASLMTR